MSTEQKRRLKTVGRRAQKDIEAAREQDKHEKYYYQMKTGLSSINDVMPRGISAERIAQYTTPNRFLSKTRTKKGGRKSVVRRRKTVRRRKSVRSRK
jgi:hypothetical protein